MHAGTTRSAFFALGLLLLATAIALPASAQDLITGNTLEGKYTTPTGDTIGPIYEQIIWLSVAVFLVVAIILLYILIRFRHKRGEKRSVPQIHGNSRLEIAWTIGPALVMIWLLIISYNGLLAIDQPEAQPEFTIDVAASRFVWDFTYPDGSKAGQATWQLSGADTRLVTLRVQEDTWVRLRVNSTDVIHAINIPGLDVMIDANPGRTNHVQFLAREPGVYLVQCRQFCGTGHGGMLAAVEVFEAGTQETPWGAAPAAAPPVTPPPEQPDNGTGNGTGNATDNETGQNQTEEPPVEVGREIEVHGFDFSFDPLHPVADLQPGETVRITLINDGPSAHNLFIGSDYDPASFQGTPLCTDPADVSTCWRTEQYTIPPGQTGSFVMTAPTPEDGEMIAFYAWCDIPTHAEQGMLSWLAIDGSEIEGFGPMEPRLPAPSAVVAAFAILGAALLVARHRNA